MTVPLSSLQCPDWPHISRERGLQGSLHRHHLPPYVHIIIIPLTLTLLLTLTLADLPALPTPTNRALRRPRYRFPPSLPNPPQKIHPHPPPRRPPLRPHNSPRHRRRPRRPHDIQPRLCAREHRFRCSRCPKCRDIDLYGIGGVVGA